MSGKFITLEGGEGAGKSTQARLLATWLRTQGLDIIETREPGGTPGADAIRALLMDKNVPLTAIAEAHLFAAARADHVERVIRPAIEHGQWVICDRFVDSSIAYQGIAGGLGDSQVRAINAPVVGSSWPDLTLLLKTDPALGAQRAGGRDDEGTDRFSERDEAFHTAVSDAFDTLAQQEPGRFSIIDASGDIDSVARAIQSVVQERLL